MAINDIYTLPKKVTKIPQMKELLQTEQTELDLICSYIEELKKELNINSCTNLIDRYERIFNLNANSSDSLEERRTKIIAKLNARGMTTVESIEEIAELLTECKCTVTEDYGNYQFIVNIEFLPSEESKKLKYLLVQIDEVKPAHLNCVIHLVYNVYGTFKPFMNKELKMFTLKELREKEIKPDNYLDRNKEYKSVMYKNLHSMDFAELRREGAWYVE